MQMLSRSLLACFLLALCNAASASPFSPMGKTGDDWEALFCGTVANRALSVNASGLFMVGGKRVGRLPFGKSELLNWLWTSPLGKDILVAYESSDRDSDSSGGGLCRLSSDLTVRRWCIHFPAFNVVATASSQGTVFLTGIGTLAEVDALSGNYLWKVDGLYDKSTAFNAFKTPVERSAKYVDFYAEAITGNGKIWRAVVDRSSGLLVSAGEAATSDGAQQVVRSAGVCAR